MYASALWTFRHVDITAKGYYGTGIFRHMDFLERWTFRQMEILAWWTFWHVEVLAQWTFRHMDISEQWTFQHRDFLALDVVARFFSAHFSSGIF